MALSRAVLLLALVVSLTAGPPGQRSPSDLERRSRSPRPPRPPSGLPRGSARMPRSYAAAAAQAARARAQFARSSGNSQAQTAPVRAASSGNSQAQTAAPQVATSSGDSQAAASAGNSQQGLRPTITCHCCRIPWPLGLAAACDQCSERHCPWCEDVFVQGVCEFAARCHTILWLLPHTFPSQIRRPAATRAVITSPLQAARPFPVRALTSPGTKGQLESSWK